MKTITEEIRSDIADAAAAGLLGQLPPAAAEKDIHITDVLAELSGIRLTHTAHHQHRSKGDDCPEKIQLATHLVFAGGTCLSKAHGLIERMSEDIDIKVMLDQVPAGYALPRGHTDCKRLGDLHRAVEQHLARIGFHHALSSQGDNPRLHDCRRYYCLAISYAGHFADVSGVLRPELKLELVHSPPILPIQYCDIGYLLNALVSRWNSGASIPNSTHTRSRCCGARWKQCKSIKPCAAISSTGFTLCC